MKCLRRLTAVLLPVAALLIVAAPTNAPSAPLAGPAHQFNEPQLAPLSAIRPEVRLRKLHLVRPDLIPYPIAAEIYC